VSLLALAQPAEAKIVYTPAQVTFGGEACGSNGGIYSLDLNHDGIADFMFDWSGLGSHCSFGSVDLVAQPTGSNGVAGSLNWAFRLRGGTLIGPQQSFSGGLMASFVVRTYRVRPNQCRGQGFWLYYCANNTNGSEQGYLGLKFSIHGQAHYGWARLNVFTNWNAPALSATLLGYAYETIPNKPIIAGRTHGKDEATLGHLATGASAIPAWRVKPTAATTH